MCNPVRQHFSVTTATDQALTGVTPQRAAAVGNPYPTQQTFAQWLNLAAFAQPGLGSFGMSPNNILGPGIFNINASLVREVRIKESTSSSSGRKPSIF